MYLYFLLNKYTVNAKVTTVVGSFPASSDTLVTKLGFPTVYIYNLVIQENGTQYTVNTKHI